MSVEIRSTFRGLLKASAAIAALITAGPTVVLAETPAELAAMATSDVREAATAGPTDESGSAGVDEVTVVGSRLVHTVDGPAPVTVFDRAKIDQLGVTNLAEVFNYLPQQSFGFSGTVNSNGARNVQLRGLANGTTLVLIDGRRTVPGASSVTQSSFDLNTIPLSAVERIEVLSDSASAVYGADAVGGVVNIVLKSSVERPVFDASYSSPEGGGAERRVSFATGGHSERARGTVVVDYYKRNALFGTERDALNNADYRRYGGVDRRVLTANPGNICAASGNLPGLGAPCAAVPAGSTGVGLTPSSFLATAGQQNFDSVRRYAAAVSAAERYSAVANGSYDISDQVTAFGEFFYTDRTDTQALQPKTIANGVVSASNPFNPFGVSVRANFLLDGLPAPYNIGHEKVYSETVGLKGRLKNWDWEVSALGAQSHQRYETYGNLDATRLNTALSATTTSQALNVFQDGPGGSFSLLSSLVMDPSTNAAAKTSDDYQISGFVRGDLLRLPAGPLQLVAGGEWRRESISYVSPSISIEAGDAKRNSSSLYAETRLPVLGSEGKIPLLHDFTLTVAGRYDDYSDFGDTFNGQYGAEWRPANTLLLRASYGESFRAPGLYLLHQPQTLQKAAQFSGGDPSRNLEPFVADWVSGGNENLGPEKSKSTSAGAVWTPLIPGRPRFSATYWRIEQNQRIVQGTAPATVIQNESLFPERVVRAPRTAADIAAGLPGKITFIDTSIINLGSLETSGVDFGASAKFETAFGVIAPSFNATRVSSYKAADYPSAPATERVGVANTNGTIPRWKATGSLTWAQGGLSVTATGRYTSSYADAANTNVRNGLEVSAVTLFDLQGAIDLGEILGARSAVSQGLRLRVGATNLFNKRPPFSDIYGYGYDPSQFDIRQRVVYAAISKSF